MRCAKFGWNWHSCSWEEDINFVKLESFHPRMNCAKFGGNCSSGYGEEDENVESLRQWQWQRWQRRRTNLIWAFGSGEQKCQ